MYLAGKSQSDIAAALNISQPTVSRDIATLIDEWKLRAHEQIDEAKAKELARIDYLEVTYRDAWERSLKEEKRHTTRMGGTIVREVGSAEERRFIQETPTVQTIQTFERLGDKKFLDGVQWCIEQRCKLLGIDLPTRIELQSEPIQFEIVCKDEKAG